MKALKVTISGTYKDSANEIKEYEKLSGTIPFCDEGKAHQACINRYSKIWISNKHTMPKLIREVYLDSIKEVDAEFSFIGKDIKEMNMVELQDLAVYLDLKLPEYKKTSLRNSRLKALEIYLLKIKAVPQDKVALVMSNQFADLPKCVIGAKEVKKVNDKEEVDLSSELEKYGVKMTNSEKEQEYTLEDLRNIAKAKGINHHPNIGYDKLHAKVFAE